MPLSSLVRRTGYASGNFGKNILANSVDILLLYVMTDMLGINPALAGLIVLSSMVLDAVLDPVVGMASDRTRGFLGRYGPYILPGAPLTALFYIGLFNLPRLDLANPLLVLFMSLGFRLGYSLIDLPHNALLAAVAPAGAERAKLSNYRFLFSSLAALVVALALRPLVSSGDQSQLSADFLAGLSFAVGLCAVVVLIGSWLSVAHLDRLSSREDRGAPSNWRGIREALRARHLQRTIALGALASLALPLFSKSLLFLATHVLGRVEAASNILTAMVSGQFVGIAIWIGLASKHASAVLLSYAHGAVAVGLAVTMALLVCAPTFLTASCFLVGIGAAGVYSLIWALVADAADRVRDETSNSLGGAIFAMAIVAQKAAMGLGGLALGVSLDLAGHGGGGSRTAIDQAIIMSGLAFPCAVTIAAAWLCRRHVRADRVETQKPNQ